MRECIVRTNWCEGRFDANECHDDAKQCCNRCMNLVYNEVGNPVACKEDWNDLTDEEVLMIVEKTIKGYVN